VKGKHSRSLRRRRRGRGLMERGRKEIFRGEERILKA